VGWARGDGELFVLAGMVDGEGEGEGGGGVI